MFKWWAGGNREVEEKRHFRAGHDWIIGAFYYLEEGAHIYLEIPGGAKQMKWMAEMGSRVDSVRSFVWVWTWFMNLAAKVAWIIVWRLQSIMRRLLGNWIVDRFEIIIGLYW